MTDRPWTFEHYRSSGQEGHATVPGGVLKYRLTGPATAANVVVFENGWSAPFPYAMWLEQALAPHVRVLSYDRPGIGDSRRPAALTPAGLTPNFSAPQTGHASSRERWRSKQH